MIKLLCAEIPGPLYKHLRTLPKGHYTLCDIDGVLVDTLGPTVDAYQLALAQHNILRTKEQIKEAVWGNSWNMAATLLGLRNADQPARLADWVHDTKVSYTLEFPIIEHNVEIVHSLMPNVVFVTSGSKEQTHEKLAKCRLNNCVGFYSCEKSRALWWLDAIPNGLDLDIVDDSKRVLANALHVGIKPRTDFECQLR